MQDPITMTISYRTIKESGVVKLASNPEEYDNTCGSDAVVNSACPECEDYTPPTFSPFSF